MSTGAADELCYQTPLWLLVTGVFLLQWAALELGRRLCLSRSAEAITGKEKEGTESYILTAVLGLLALLLAFTFSLAMDRADVRRQRVLEEANAIGTTYLRAQTFPEPHRSRISGLLVKYVDNRLALFSVTDTEQINQQLVVASSLQTQMWAATVAALGTVRDDVSSAYMQSMNETIDLAAARLSARRAHVPSLVFLELLLYMTIAAGMLGYVFFDIRWTTAALYVILVTMSFQLILDIDSPRRGSIVESQQAMEDLKAFLSTRPPAAFGPGPEKLPPPKQSYTEPPRAVAFSLIHISGEE